MPTNTKLRPLLIAASLALLATLAPGKSAFAEKPPTAPAIEIDFDATLKSVGFDLTKTDGNLDASGAGNGIPDAEELALVAEILKNPKLPVTKGGVKRSDVVDAFAQARASAHQDFASLEARWPKIADLAAGYAMLGEGSKAAFAKMSTGFGVAMKGDYSKAVALGRFLAWNGDADGDGVTNKDEYLGFIGKGRAAYLKAALDATIKPDPRAVAASGVAATTSRKTVGVVLYTGFEVLDVFGPTEMWSYIPDFKVVMIAEKAGPVKSAQGVSAVAEMSFADAPQLDIIMVPGGVGTRTELNNPAMLDFIRKQNEKTQLTTSVCTGSALLAKAGVLKGRKATSNKAFFSLATEQDASVDWQGKARWVEDGKFITSSGVSAGTDMALGLIAKFYGRDRAAQLARSLEYQWSEDAANDPFAIQFAKAVGK